MFWLIVFLGLLYTPDFFCSSEKPVSGKKIKLQFKDTGDLIFEYPIEYVKYSETAKNMLEELGDTDLPVPLANATNETCKCLIDTFVKELYNKEDTLFDAREKFKELKLKCPHVAPADLLIQSNYLDVKPLVSDKKQAKHMEFKSLIASLYADYLKNNQFKVINESGVISCDGIPHDLEPLVAGWLLRDLFEGMKNEVIKRDFEFSDDVMYGPILNNNGSWNGFACTWTQVGRDFMQISALGNRYAYFNFSTKKPFQGKRLSTGTRSLMSNNLKTQSAVSEDGEYLLVIDGDLDTIPNPIKATLFLYNLSKPKESDQKSMLPDHACPLSHSIDEIVSVLFDNEKKLFNIIAYSQNASEGASDKKFFYRHTVALKPLSIQTKKEDISDANKGRYVFSSSMK